MRIIVDVDCTVADFVGAICRVVDVPDRSIAKEWDWFKSAYSPRQTEQVRKEMSDHRFWSKLPVIRDANKGIAWLRAQGHDIVWVTAPFRACFGWCDARREWLNRNFNIDKHNEPLVFTKAKYLVGADVIIDDMPEIVDAYGAAHPDALCLTYWSELNCKTDREKVHWEDIMGIRFFWHGKHFGKYST